jgi:hypothetical protein
LASIAISIYLSIYVSITVMPPLGIDPSIRKDENNAEFIFNALINSVHKKKLTPTPHDRGQLATRAVKKNRFLPSPLTSRLFSFLPPFAKVFLSQGERERERERKKMEKETRGMLRGSDHGSI